MSQCVILKHHYAFFSFKDYQETTKNHFWVGVHQIEYQGIWGYQQGGILNDSHIPFLVWRNPENDNDYCADMTKHYGMWKSPCAEKKPYICESGKLDKNVKKCKTNSSTTSNKINLSLSTDFNIISFRQCSYVFTTKSWHFLVNSERYIMG